MRLERPASEGRLGLVGAAGPAQPEHPSGGELGGAEGGASEGERSGELEQLLGRDAGGEPLETLASGVADGRPVTLADGRRVRRWYVRPLLLYDVREGSDVVVSRARHEARRSLEP